MDVRGLTLTSEGSILRASLVVGGADRTAVVFGLIGDNALVDFGCPEPAPVTGKLVLGVLEQGGG